jgi:hypothetical protein
MRHVVPLLVIVLVLAACGDSTDEGASTSTVTTTLESSDVEATADGGAPAEPVDEEPVGDEPTTTDVPDDGEPASSEAPDDEIGLLCSAYLDSIDPSTFDQGLAALASILGDDAPSGVLDAIDTLTNPDDDIEAFFLARNSIDSYVLPVCEQRFRREITPLADNSEAAEAFVAAVRDGDRASAELLAPTNVIIQFDWMGYPQATAEFGVDSPTISLVLEPTVTVFCQLDGGAVEFCAFGE